MTIREKVPEFFQFAIPYSNKNWTIFAYDAVYSYKFVTFHDITSLHMALKPHTESQTPLI